MKCFYHRDADAVGVCKACNKGLCDTCAVDVGGGLACRESCVDQVRRINELVQRNIRISPTSEALLAKQASGYLIAGAFAIVAGSVFAVIALNMEGVFRTGMAGIGVLVVLLGLRQAWLGWRLRSAATRIG